MQKVFIVILNWNGWKDTVECLESLYRIDYPNYEVILIDNFSTNDSVDKIKEWCNGKIEVSSEYFSKTKCTHKLNIVEYSEDKYPGNQEYFYEQPDGIKNLTIIKNNENYGFAGGCNIGIKYVLNQKKGDDLILLLNNDTCVDEKFLTNLVTDLELDNKIGIISPINYNYYNGSIDFYGGGINWFQGRPYHIRMPNSQRYFDFLTGSCMLISCDSLRLVGGFDERYFCYFEDADLCQRMVKKGYKLAVSRKSRIYHKINASSGSQSPFMIYHLARNRIFFNKKFNLGYKLVIFYVWQTLIKSILTIFYFNNQQRLAWFKGIKDSFESNK